jgi:hypothetical protein
MQTRSERFWKRVSGNINRGNYYGNVKTQLPSTQEMNIMDKYKIIYDIDPEIRKLVINISKAGYKTVGSCAGHSKIERGFVTIIGNFHKLKEEERTKIITIFKNYGLKNIRIHPLNNTLHIRITFDPIGIIKKSNLIRGKESPTSFSSSEPAKMGRPVGSHNKIIYKDTKYIGINEKDVITLRNKDKEGFEKAKNNILIGSKFKEKVRSYKQQGFDTHVFKVKGKEKTGPYVYRLWVSTKKVKKI